MTYLAGLEAKSVIWIAKDFHEPHLSAIRWLNQHTVDPFGFFAVRLRVVRIGSSLPAPIFEVLERPNGWERRLQVVAQEQREIGETAELRRAFWAAYRERFPDDIAFGVPVGGSNWWWLLGESGVLISIYFGVKRVGLFVRGRSGSELSEINARLAPHQGALEARLGVALGDPGGDTLLIQRNDLDMRDRANWPAAMDWLHEKARAYAMALTEILKIEV